MVIFKELSSLYSQSQISSIKRPMMGRKSIYLYFACIVSVLRINYAAGTTKSGCLEKEKAIAFLEIAEGLLSKARDSYPSCREDFNSSNLSECSTKKSLAFIEMSKKLIADARENFPTCSKDIIVEKYKPKDCSEILASGQNKSGVYTVWPRECSTVGKSLQVYCDMNTDGGGWTMIQRRGKFPVQQDFFRDWESYKNGFGNITQEFWLGNENIRVLCHKGCKIRFDLQDKDGQRAFALYQSFSLSIDYILNINNYSGTAGDSMQSHNSVGFATKDKDINHRANSHNGGWWYQSYSYCNPNGIYQPCTAHHKNIFWHGFRKWENLGYMEIKIKPNEI